jgi:hypothetical protein
MPRAAVRGRLLLSALAQRAVAQDGREKAARFDRFLSKFAVQCTSARVSALDPISTARELGDGE